MYVKTVKQQNKTNTLRKKTYNNNKNRTTYNHKYRKIDKTEYN